MIITESTFNKQRSANQVVIGINGSFDIVEFIIDISPVIYLASARALHTNDAR